MNTNEGPSQPCMPSLGEHCSGCHRCAPLPPPTDYEYACQKYESQGWGQGEWRVVGVGPGPLSAARDDFLAWQEDGYTVRIVRRPVADWQVTDQTFTSAGKGSSHGC